MLNFYLENIDEDILRSYREEQGDIPYKWPLDRIINKQLLRNTKHLIELLKHKKETEDSNDRLSLP